MMARAEAGPLLIEVQDHVAWVSIKLPERMNALSPEELCRLSALVEEADDNPEVHVTIISGKGRQAFCAGIDMLAIDASDAARFQQPMRDEVRNPFERIAETR